MTWPALLSALGRLGARLWREGDRLKIDAPRGALSKMLLEAMQQHKADLMAVLEGQPLESDEVAERAAVAWEGGLSDEEGKKALEAYDRLSGASRLRKTTD